MRRVVAFCLLLSFGCSSSNEVEEVFTCENLKLDFQGVDYADCGETNGALTVFASGGKEPYLYRNGINGTPQTSNVFTGLETNYHTIYVEDQNGCTDSARTFIGALEGVKAVALTRPSGCGDNKGSIRIVARNGIEPYEYQLGENANYTNEDTFYDLPSGKYSMWVKDDLDCRIGLFPVVLSGMEYDAISGLITTNCSNADCHGGSAEPSLVEEDDIIFNADQIVAVADQKDPIHYNHQLSNIQVDSIACWVNDLNLLKEE